MTDILNPVIGRIIDASRQSCGYTVDDTEATDCGQPATWHILWAVGLDSGFACEPHMALVQRRYVYVDRHRPVPGCGSPAQRWDFTKRCCVEEPPGGAAAVRQAEERAEEYRHIAAAARGASGARDYSDLTDTILALRDRAEQAEEHRRALAVALDQPAGTPFAELIEYAASAIALNGSGPAQT